MRSAAEALAGSARGVGSGTMAGERGDLVLRIDPSVAVTGVAADVFHGGDDAAAIVPKDATVRLSPFELRWP